MDILLIENFDLRRQIIFEKKKYAELSYAYQDLRNNIKDGFLLEKDFLNPDISQDQIKNGNQNSSPDSRISFKNNKN